MSLNDAVTAGNDDPLNENLEPLELGVAYFRLEGLAYLMDNPSVVSIIGQNSSIMGKLEINIIPVDTDGVSEVPDDMIPEDPMELENQRMDFRVEIVRAFDLMEDFCQDIHCEYQFYIEDQKFSTQIVEGKNREPVFNYKHHHTVEPCTKNFIEYLLKESVIPIHF